MVTNLILIRHAETSCNHTGQYQGQIDNELSTIGKNQAKALAKSFYFDAINNKNYIDAIYSSDLKRAQKTATYISKQLCIPINLMKNLREISFGLWEGLTFDEIYNKWPKEAAQFIETPALVKIPQGESVIELQQRAMLALDKICKNHINQTVIIVTHGGFIKTVIAKILHMPLSSMWNLEIGNTSITKIKYFHEIKCCQLTLLNDLHHLKT